MKKKSSHSIHFYSLERQKQKQRNNFFRVYQTFVNASVIKMKYDLIYQSILIGLSYSLHSCFNYQKHGRFSIIHCIKMVRFHMKLMVLKLRNSFSHLSHILHRRCRLRNDFYYEQVLSTVLNLAKSIISLDVEEPTERVTN